MSVPAGKEVELLYSDAPSSAPDLAHTSSEVLIHGPEFKLDLTLLDQGFDDLYPTTGLRFRKRDDATPAAIEALVVAALHRLARQVPWVASRVVPRPSADLVRRILQVAWRALRANVGLRLRPTEATTTYDVLPAALPLTVAHWDDGGGAAEALDNVKLPPGLWSHVPGAGCAVQLNFAPDNRVILCFTVHHALGDAHTIITLIKLLAQQMRDLQGDPDDLKPTHAIRPLPAALDRSELMRRTPMQQDFSVPRAIDVKTYTLSEFLRVVYEAIAIKGEPPVAHCLVQIPMSSFRTFKVALGYRSDARLPVTYHDFVCGLLFRSVMGARRRAGLLPGGDDTVVTLSQPVNFRRRCGLTDASKGEPELGSEYMGNGLVFVRATVTLGELFNGEAEEGILAAAMAIRYAITAVHDKSLEGMLDMYASAPDPRLVRPSILFEMKTTAMMLTSWHGFPLYDIAWGPALSYVGRGQPCAASWNGFFFILPADRDGDCSIGMNLNSNVMSQLQGDIAWVRYSRREE